MSFLAVGLLGVSALAAQSPASQPAPAKPATHHSAHNKAHPAPAPVAPVPQPVAPVAPPPPDWPVNDRPAPPGVTWNQSTLQIDAPNSSLKQILDGVAKATGATVEGLGADQRIFGVYGPGNARDVLAQLLLGSGYNFILIGDNGQGLPRQIVLSSAHSLNAPAANVPAGRRQASDADDNDDDVVDNQVDPTPPPPPPVRPAFGQEGAPRTPQQIMQEQQERQQQQNQQPGAPTNQPNNQPPN